MTEPVRPDEKQVESWRQALRVLQSMDMHERERHFDMFEWGYKTACGTVACIAGHCCLDEWFINERGLSAKWTGNRLCVDYEKFTEAFGSWGEIFMSCSITNHADAVRAVLLRIARDTNTAIVPYGFGMPVMS